MGEVQVEEDGGDDGRVGEEREEAHWATAGGAEQGQDLIDAGEEDGPADARGARGPGRPGVGQDCRLPDGLGVHGWGRDGLGPADGDDGVSGSCVGRHHTVVSVTVHPGRRDEPGEALDELDRGDQNLGAPVGRGLGEAVEEPGLKGRE